MHNLQKIKLFKIVCWITYPIALIIVYPITLLKKKNKSHLFFFFDRYVIGGAQRIHLDILDTVEDVKKQVYFTRLSTNEALKKAFYNIPNTICKDIHFWCDNLLFRPFTVHFFAFYINRHKNAHVFSSNSTFFYDMLPFLKKQHIKTELLHNFTHGKNGMEYFGLANHKLLNHRVIYDSYTLSNIKKQYKEYRISENYLKNLLFIEPGVEVPITINKRYALPLTVLYAGRGGVQKRIYLLDKIAAHCIKNKWDIQFHFAGTMIDEVSELVKNNVIIHGEISDKEAMNRLYEQSHIIIMTSAYEGFPMLIKEGMAYGCIPIVTALEGNKMHLSNGFNALLIDAIENEDKVVEQGIHQLKLLLDDASLVQNLSAAAYKYAREKFTKEQFNKGYRKLLL